MNKTTDIGLPMLYSRRSDKKIQTWQIEVDVAGRFRVHSGIEGGKTVTSEWTQCVGKNPGKKNATTPQQQAEKEARAVWQQKQDDGYKTDVKDVDLQTFFAPMLAHGYEDYKDLVATAFENREPVYCQPKLDGMRCIVRPDGMWSRNGKPVPSAPHIHKHITSMAGIGRWCFDGELYADKFADDFNAIISLAKKGKPTAEALRMSAEHLQYHVYDYPSAAGGFWNRYRCLRDTIGRHSVPSIVLVETVPVECVDQISELFGKWREAGYEGAMIRLDHDYEAGRRSKHLLKFKEFMEEDFTVLDVLEGVGNRSKMAGMLAFKTAAGRDFTAAIKGNFTFFRRLLADKKNVKGKIASVQFQNWTPDGSPRFPCVKAIRDYE